MTPPLDPALVEQFRADVERLTGEAPAPERKLALAVSGGPDSLAMLLLAHAAWPGAIIAATVDHGLRPGSAEEAALVHRLCGERGVPHDILTRPDGMVLSGNLLDQARSLRYTLLNFWAGSGTLRNARPWRAEWVAVAHQMDDVAESFLMRARRGAGVGGMAAMAPIRPLMPPVPGPLLIRPLLNWRRDALAAIVTAAGVEPVTDPSNANPRFDRSRIRVLLARTPDLPVERLALAAANLRDAEAALEWATAREWAARARITDDNMVALAPGNLPHELRRRLVERAIDHVRFEFDLAEGESGRGLDRLVAALDQGRGGTLAGVRARIRGTEWHFSPAPPRRSL